MLSNVAVTYSLVEIEKSYVRCFASIVSHLVYIWHCIYKSLQIYVCDSISNVYCICLFCPDAVSYETKISKLQTSKIVVLVDYSELSYAAFSVKLDKSKSWSINCNIIR